MVFGVCCYDKTRIFDAEELDVEFINPKFGQEHKNGVFNLANTEANRLLALTFKNDYPRIIG